MSARTLEPAAVELVTGMAPTEAAACREASSGLCSEAQLRERVAVNVQRLRLQRGMTICAAADRARMHRRHWQKVEAEDVRFTVGTLGRLAAALEVAPSELCKEPSFT